MRIIKFTFLLTIFFMTACHGYRYSVIEDRETFLLKGEFYNNNPFVNIKAILPNSYLVKKTTGDSAATENIRSTGYREEEILDGLITDHGSSIEIHLVIFDHRSKEKRPAHENGLYRLIERVQVEDLSANLSNIEAFLLEQLKP